MIIADGVSVERFSVDAYRVRVGAEWADVFLDTGGRPAITIQSTFGTYAYTWSNIGQCFFTEFLGKLSFDYFMGKTRPDYRVFDPVATAIGIARDIEASWRAGDMSADLALDGLRELELIELHRIADATAFLMGFEATWLAECLYDRDLSGLARTKASGECVTFWETLWPALCEAWKRERASEAAVAAGAPA